MEITVNDAVIAEADIARETQYHPAPSFEEARLKAGQALAGGDRVVVRRSPHPLRLVVSPDHDRFEILRTKLGWGAE